jgi:hypothetical protein
MKKIVFIDDEIERLDTLKKLCKEYNDILFSTSIYKYFQPDKNGKSVSLVVPIDDIQFFFIHKSINDEKKIPETFFSLIKNIVKESEIFTFSGGSSNDAVNKILKRENLYSNFLHFVRFSKRYNEWFIPCLYKPNEYEKLYAKKLYEEVNKFFIRNNQIECIAYEKLESLIDLPKENYKRFNSFSHYMITLKNKIEEL